MPIPIPDFEGENRKAIRRNLEDVIKDLDTNNKDLEQKINNFAELFEFDVNEIKQHIRDNKLFRAKFAISPKRQGIDEKLAGRFIKQLPEVKNFKTLSKNGKNALQLLNGAIMSPKEVKERGGTETAKTIDFEWEIGLKKIYASHKHTTDGLGGGGGGQNLQYRDIQNFIREANESHKQDTIFLAIADGPYYDMNDTTSRTTKLQRLKDMANRRTVFALSSFELEEFLQNL